MLRLATGPLRSDWRARHGGKVAGFLVGSVGTLVFALFVLVAATGEPYTRSAPPPAPALYPVL